MNMTDFCNACYAQINLNLNINILNQIFTKNSIDANI